MAKVLSVIAVLFLLAAPTLANAQDRLVLVQQEQQELMSYDGVDPGKILAIGAGIVVGTVVVGSAFGFQGAGLVGAVAGGLVANWWYGQGDDILSLEPRDSSYY